MIGDLAALLQNSPETTAVCYRAYASSAALLDVNMGSHVLNCASAYPSFKGSHKAIPDYVCTSVIVASRKGGGAVRQAT